MRGTRALWAGAFLLSPAAGPPWILRCAVGVALHKGLLSEEWVLSQISLRFLQYLSVLNTVGVRWKSVKQEKQPKSCGSSVSLKCTDY